MAGQRRKLSIRQLARNNANRAYAELEKQGFFDTDKMSEKDWRIYWEEINRTMCGYLDIPY